MVLQPYLCTLLCTCQTSVEFLVIRPVNTAATLTVTMSENFYTYDIFLKIQLESFGGFIIHIRHAPRLNRVEKLQI